MFNAIVRNDVQLCNVYVCISTDTKDETDKGNGDILIEIDTGKSYMFNADGAAGSKWVEMGV